VKKTSYRLAEYEIMEVSDGSIWWKAHVGFGAAASGKCFIEGNVLFISSPMEMEEPASLKNEFLEHLRSLPKWEKTRYYCTRYELHACSSAKPAKKRRSRSPVGIADSRTFHPTRRKVDIDNKPSEISELEPDDFDLFMENNNISLAAIGEGLLKRFGSVASRLKKLRRRN